MTNNRMFVVFSNTIFYRMFDITMKGGKIRFHLILRVEGIFREIFNITDIMVHLIE